MSSVEKISYSLLFLSLSDVLQDAKRHLGVLLLLPPSVSESQQHPSNRLRLTKPPVEVLKKMAQVLYLNPRKLKPK